MGQILQIHHQQARRVTPSEVAVTGVTLAPSTDTIEVGKTAVLTATVTPDDATDKTVIFSSSDNTVATVAADGTVTAIKAGTVTITGETGGKTGIAEITVTETTE
ncbi:hypothetical protein [Lactobacillus brevis] [Lactiplantibacillus mudanjiangensis]|uniref:Ig-like domain-containing protein n=1 Tax=Lactiplantibacillus mudanjiangensis TaxID=1296538 RepID=UPI0010159579|nr:hypothetical protein [Lactobacillus brevis] [Lactiplantibacillus mudanjiangensis]